MVIFTMVLGIWILVMGVVMGENASKESLVTVAKNNEDLTTTEEASECAKDTKTKVANSINCSKE